ncbi:MAG: alpha/beta hydrolase-fold protein [Pseudomonadota bacterium]
MAWLQGKRALSVLLTCQLVAWGSALAQEPFASPRSAVIPITDSAQGGAYELYIRLPEDYGEDPDARHPVIYATDGLWHFETLAGTMEFMMESAIFVGISWQTDLGADRPHVSRFRDYTVLPATDPEVQARYNVGQAANHLRFIRDDVIPYVEDNYQADPEERTYFGFSLGGLFGAYVLIAEPETFRHFILGSPSSGERSVAYLSELEEEGAPERGDLDVHVYLTVGGLEEDRFEGVNALADLFGRWEGQGLSLTGPLVIENSGHSDSFPPTAVGGIKWLTDMAEAPAEGE